MAMPMSMDFCCFLKDNANKDSVGEKDAIQVVGVLGEHTEDEEKQKKSKDPSSDEVPPSNERESPRKWDKLPKSCCLDKASDNEAVGLHLSSPVDSPGNCFARTKEKQFF
jgi:hypothetical protein